MDKHQRSRHRLICQPQVIGSCPIAGSLLLIGIPSQFALFCAVSA
jgi:hypothetical protein